MESVVDLDEAAGVIAERAVRWRAHGLAVGRLTWRDADAAWPQPFETDRGRVRDPDSVGVALAGAEDAELTVVLFRGGWADVDFVVDLDDAGSLPASDIASAADFGSGLDRWVAGVFGVAAQDHGPA
ncbi:hypothetical protein AB0N09_27500 [Streptomyces erythrochromogenes]|uniref:hypothetical protein n=1 Tax=Streptomyces erythrochromogenes TaxID=285574 RepID=UPI00342BB5C4